MARVPPTIDRVSFAAFVERHRADLVRTACRIAGDSAEAEDVVQDTLVAMWQRWQRRRPDNPSAYAFRAVTLNAIRSPDAAAAGGPAGSSRRLDGAVCAAEPLDPLELSGPSPGSRRRSRSLCECAFIWACRWLRLAETCQFHRTPPPAAVGTPWRRFERHSVARGIPPGLERKRIMETKEEPRVEFGKGHALAIAAVFAAPRSLSGCQQSCWGWDTP